MKDLDFDELDKAVNSLMQGGLKPAEEETTANVSNESVEPAAVVNQLAPIETPTVAQQEETVVAAGPAAPAVSTPAQPAMNLAPKRSGRFMDVMHPSSDMRPPLSMPTRVGKEISPVSTEPTTVPEPVAEQPAFTEMPDPIELSASDGISRANSTDNNMAAEAGDMPTPEVPEETSSHLDTPTSPFLSDAKVEKRPLGGTNPAPEVGAADTPIDEAIDQSFASQPQTPETPVPLPVELSGDVVSIESDATNHVAAISQPETTPAGVAMAGSSSIAQQYKEKENSGDQSHAPIYDTNVQPLAHPAKKKSGWGVVLLIVLIILLCVGVAAGLYFAGIIQLPM